MPTKPHNFNLAKELAERSEIDWRFGALSQPALVSIPSGEREKYLPLGETQFDSYADFTDCASRSPVNHLEAVFNYHYQHAMLPENKLWFEENQYIQDGKITFSDRYIAVLSGTTHEGNSLKAPIEAIRKQGLIPKKLLPKTDTMTWDEYYTPIPQNLKDIGQEFLKRFTINYEQVAKVHYSEVLKDDMLGVAGYAWNSPDANDVYHSDSMQFNHAFLIYDFPQWQIFDNYLEKPDDFTKNLAPDYTFYDYAYRVYVSTEKKIEDELEAQLTLLQKLLKLINEWFSMKPPDTTGIITRNGYKWDNPGNVRHSVRVICDESGLSLAPTVLIDGKRYTPKDVLCAVIRQESNFNPRAIGSLNSNLTRDYGLCQYNTGKNQYGQAYWIGKGAAFTDINEVLNDPEKNVRVLIKQFKAGNLRLWSSVSTGAYKKWLPKQGASRPAWEKKENNGQGVL